MINAQVKVINTDWYSELTAPIPADDDADAAAFSKKSLKRFISI